MSTTARYGAPDSSSPYSAASPSGLSAGDDMYLAAAWLHAAPANSTTVTVPTGWNPVGRYDFTTGAGGGSAVESIALYQKPATSGDIGASHSVTLSVTTTAAVRAFSVSGGYGLDAGSIVTTGRANGAGGTTWTPAAPAGSGFARGFLLSFWPGVGGGAGGFQSGGSNGWVAGDSGFLPLAIFSIGDTTRPMTPPVLNDGSGATHRFALAFAIKAVPTSPNPWGYNLSFGQRSGL